jgi:uncharacterized Zn finger protein
MSWETHDCCPECGNERTTGSMLLTAGASDAKAVTCTDCGEKYVQDR